METLPLLLPQAQGDTVPQRVTPECTMEGVETQLGATLQALAAMQVLPEGQDVPGVPVVLGLHTTKGMVTVYITPTPTKQQ